jgi:hypothetical protein
MNALAPSDFMIMRAWLKLLRKIAEGQGKGIGNTHRSQ